MTRNLMPFFDVWLLIAFKPYLSSLPWPHIGASRSESLGALSFGARSPNHMQVTSVWLHPQITIKKNKTNQNQKSQSPFLALQAIKPCFQAVCSPQKRLTWVTNLLTPSWYIHGIMSLDLQTKFCIRGPFCYCGVSTTPC